MDEEQKISAIEKAENKELPKGYSPETIDVVRQTVFPNATDPQLALFFHKCTTMGIHPLSGLVHPQVYNTKDGQRVVFVTSIDYMRAKSNEDGEYDGCDEEEFEGALQINTDQGTITVPELARFRVYCKGVSRPSVGVARWVEYYPGNGKRGEMWRKMPHTMLAKCAEALARRKAFPANLNKIYAEEEMMQATVAALPAASTKPRVTATKPKSQGVEPTQINASDTPDDTTRKSNKWISTAQEKRLYAMCKKAGVEIDALKKWLCGSLGIEKVYQVTWVDKQYEKICEAVEKTPKKINEYQQDKEAVEVVEAEPVNENEEDVPW